MGEQDPPRDLSGVNASQPSSTPTAGEQSPSAVDVWKRLEATPGFNEDMRKAIKDINEGRGISSEEVHRGEKTEQPHQE